MIDYDYVIDFRVQWTSGFHFGGTAILNSGKLKSQTWAVISSPKLCLTIFIIPYGQKGYI